ncbi:LysE family translocator [Rhodoferax sp. GW822-FHT02A01]|uniref:LysE family translocator n=1 Tax=Rhodoferax sp. GW822-FHT02A01 TaxID=3141537 RepID=UPI00315CCD6F
MISLEFLVTSLVVVVTPGTGVLLTVSTALSQGRLAGVYAAMGCTLGILPHMLAAGLGLAAAMHAGSLAFQALKVLGVLYLLYLAVLTWRDRTAFTVDEARPPVRVWSLVTKAILLNSLNPKLSLFFLAFLPQFMDASAAQPLVAFGVLSAVFMTMTLAVFVGYGMLAHGFRSIVIQTPTVQAGLRKSFAVAFVFMAARLAWTEGTP